MLPKSHALANSELSDGLKNWNSIGIWRIPLSSLFCYIAYPNLPSNPYLRSSTVDILLAIGKQFDEPAGQFLGLGGQLLDVLLNDLSQILEVKIRMGGVFLETQQKPNEWLTSKIFRSSSIRKTRSW